MAVYTEAGQQTTLDVSFMDGDARRTIASCTCAIRPGRGMVFTVDILQDAPGHMEEAAAEITAYLRQEIAKARTLGIPVHVPEGAEEG